MHTLMLQANWIGYWDYNPSSQLTQMMNGQEEQDNDEIYFNYNGNNNTNSLVSIGCDEIADGSNNLWIYITFLAKT